MNLSNSSSSLDNLIAQLNIMTTDFIFSRHPCRHRAIAIAHKLQQICHHMELSFFPEQQQVYCKMLKVWKALAYDENKNTPEESTKKTEPNRSVSMH